MLWLALLVVLLGAGAILLVLTIDQQDVRWTLEPTKPVVAERATSTTIPLAAVVTPTSPSTNVPILSATSESLLPTTAPPLASVPFPPQATDYPSDWPGSLRFPEQFVLVDASSGPLPENASMVGWAAKLRFQGLPKTGAELMGAYFERNGWSMVDHTDLDGGGVLLVVTRAEPVGSSVAVLDPDPSNPEETKVLVTIFGGSPLD